MVPLPGSKKHSNLMFAGRGFYEVFSYGELKNESDSVVDALKGAHVAESDRRGQKTLKSNFCRETLLTNLSVSGPRTCG